MWACRSTAGSARQQAPSGGPVSFHVSAGASGSRAATAAASAATEGAGVPTRITLQVWPAIVGPSMARIARSAKLSGIGAEPVALSDIGPPRPNGMHRRPSTWAGERKSPGASTSRARTPFRPNELHRRDDVRRVIGQRQDLLVERR